MQDLSFENKWMGPWTTPQMHYLFLQASPRQSSIIFRHFFRAHRFLSEFNSFTSRSSENKEHRFLEKALKVLDIINPQSGGTGGQGSHVRIIQGFLEDLLETSPRRYLKPGNKTVRGRLTDATRLPPDEDPQNHASTSRRSGIFLKEDAFSLFHEMYKEGICTDATTVSGILSECGATKSLDTGLQLHSLSVKTGLDECIPVASSLISFYSKCGLLDDAYQIFDKMPRRNTVLWTSIITGYAQHWQVETCLRLFVKMRQLTLKPNDFTLSSVICSCAGTGCLQLGRVIHSQEIQLGFDSYLYVLNALISMYAKCGSISEALCIFEKMPCKDLISWNSMISGYAQHGLGEQAVALLKQMEAQRIAPDAITFLGVLSSCRHAGLVEQGRHCFSLMLEYGLDPEPGHYSCIVDLLGRAGLIEEALDFIEKMPICSNAVIWGSLLSSCRVYGNTWLGIWAAENRLLLEPSCAATHVQLANLYASSGDWGHTAKVRKLMKEKGLKTSPGYSWIEVQNEVFKFKAEDGSNAHLKEIIVVLDCLIDHMKSLSYMAEVNLDLHEIAHL